MKKYSSVLVTFCPLFRSLPKLANQSPPLLQMVGVTATVSTLATVVGHPNTPTSAGNGGFNLGLPCLPSNDSIRDYNITSNKIAPFLSTKIYKLESQGQGHRFSKLMNAIFIFKIRFHVNENRNDVKVRRKEFISV